MPNTELILPLVAWVDDVIKLAHPKSGNHRPPRIGSNVNDLDVPKTAKCMAHAVSKMAGRPRGGAWLAYTLIGDAAQVAELDTYEETISLLATFMYVVANEGNYESNDILYLSSASPLQEMSSILSGRRWSGRSDCCRSLGPQREEEAPLWADR